MRLNSDRAERSFACDSPAFRLLTPLEGSLLQGDLPDDIVRLWQDFDGGPLIAVVGPRAGDAQLQRAADRLRVPVAELERFRAMQR
jgi:hypothetical protein